MRAGYLVLGCGSIGQRHIRNLRSIGIDNVSAFDPDPARLANVVTQQGVIAHVDLNEALARKPAAVLVCTPPALHAAQALQALDNGSHVFMEKPIAEAMDRVEELLSRARRDRRILYVGYNLRFHAGLIKLKGLLDEGAIGRLMVVRAEVGQYLPDWRPDQDYRKGYNASSALGGGIILDASHELDYVRWLAGEVSTVACIANRLSDLEIDTEDTAAIMLRMASGAIAEIHLDCIQRSYSRNCKILGSRGTLQWDHPT